ncbi:ABC transporter permease [Lactobacillus sp. ESL0731]|uniref:ABC transporter permease n=1 Tax=unclassified Lactobacillus TaxID=2620435 RepID=UPI0023FA069B|nr:MULTISPECIES: ABC transporter permease [unclassified Lactobacillus]WEV50635.1 ABC transporter permease [Lactobacillus sp. ESL0700]WEV61765.1 ABC transporter permease [Lactobacillus sp. ESL0731]
MYYLVKRNLTLFSRNRARAFFSLLGALITFALYIVFLKQTLKSSLPHINNIQQILDNWQMGGTLAVASITTTLTGLSSVVSDRENNILQDLSLTERSKWQIRLSYLISSVIVGSLLQIILLIFMLAYFIKTDNLAFTWSNLPIILIIILVSSLLSAICNDLLVSFIKTFATLTQVNLIIGTASGFLVGSYIPLGIAPKAAQLVMKLTPATYVASLYRRLFVGNTVPANLRTRFVKDMGIRLEWHNHLLTIPETLTITFAILLAVIIIDYLTQKFNPREA